VRNNSGSGFGLFIFGLILFPLSICFIFYNERSAVKDTQFTDILEPDTVKEYNSSNINTLPRGTKGLHLYTGTINIFENAKVNGFELEEHVFRQNHINQPGTFPPPSTLQNDNQNQQLNQTQIPSVQQNNQPQNETVAYSQTIRDRDSESVKLVAEPSKFDNQSPQLNQYPQFEQTPQLGFLSNRILAYDFIIEDFLSKEETQDNNGNVEIKNIWNSSPETPLFKENKGLFTAIYNFDNQVRLKDIALLEEVIKSDAQTLAVNDQIKQQFQNYIQIYEIYRNYHIYTFGDHVYITQNALAPERNGFFEPIQFNFMKGDLKIQIKYLKVENGAHVTLVGEFSYNDQEQIYEAASYDTGIKQAGFFCLVNCQDDEKTYQHHLMKFATKNKTEIIQDFHEQNSTKRWAFRFLGWFLHWLSVIFILYPVFFILNFIPILGALTAMVLMFAACLCSCGTFLGFLVIAWVIARPIFAIILLVATIGLIVGGVALATSHQNQPPPPQNNTQPQQPQQPNNQPQRKTGFF
jgi:hypothetical protein